MPSALIGHPGGENGFPLKDCGNDNLRKWESYLIGVPYSLTAES